MLRLSNKRNSPAEVTLPQSAPYTLTVVDEQTGENNPRVTQEIGTTLKLAPFALINEEEMCIRDRCIPGAAPRLPSP